MSALSFVTAAERPDLADEMNDFGGAPWEEFLGHDDVINEHWHHLYELAPGWQLALIDEGAGALAAIGNCIPIQWDGDPASLPDGGVDAVLPAGVALLGGGAAPTAVSALQIVVAPERLGTGLSTAVVRAMAELAGRHGLADLVAPVRPTQKHRYPLIAMERYVEWRRDDGLPFDPWIRVHERVGGELLRVAPESMRVTGSVADWESWTGMAMPASGSYVVAGALVPVEIDRERDVGEYVEPNCWMRHGVVSRPPSR